MASPLASLTPTRLVVVVCFLCSLTHTAAQHVNFTACYNDYVLKFDVNNTQDPQQCFRYDMTGQNRKSYDPYLSLEGCYDLCGHGYQLWPATDTAKRFGLYILPVILLAGRYAFAPVGFDNVCWTFVHLIGDPIDSMWSTLTRQEKARRNYHRASMVAPGAARDVAAVLTAYDQWWQDPAKDFEEHLNTRNKMDRPATHDDFISPTRTNTADAIRRPLSQSTASSPLRPSHRRGDSQQSVQSNISSNPDTVPVPDLLSPDEIFHIKYAAHRLAVNRSTNLVLSWVAIAGFLVSLTATYIRTAISQTNNQTSHTLAVVMLFSFLSFAIYISGHVGNFAAPEKVIDVITGLHVELPKLFPKPTSKFLPKAHQESFSQRYERAHPWAGINNSWRPNKMLEEYNRSDRGRWMLLSISVYVILVSWGAAFGLSYLTPLRGFGCRSGSWSAIAVAWILSALFDVLLNFLVWGTPAEKAKKLWCFTLTKDLLITIGSIGLVVVAQVGLMNTCWCRASVIFQSTKNACIDLGPVSDQQIRSNWLMWLAFPVIGMSLHLTAIFIAGYEGESGRLLFIRTKSVRMAEGIALENMAKRLGISMNSTPKIKPNEFRASDSHMMSGAIQATPASASTPPRHRQRSSTPSPRPTDPYDRDSQTQIYGPDSIEMEVSNRQRRQNLGIHMPDEATSTQGLLDPRHAYDRTPSPGRYLNSNGHRY